MVRRPFGGSTFDMRFASRKGERLVASWNNYFSIHAAVLKSAILGLANSGNFRHLRCNKIIYHFISTTRIPVSPLIENVPPMAIVISAERSVPTASTGKPISTRYSRG